MTARPLIKESLCFLNNNGLNPLKGGVKSRAKVVLTVVILSILTTSALVELVHGWKGIESLDAAAGFVGIYQIGTNVFALILNRKKLAEVLRNINEHFWKLDRYGSKLEGKALGTYRIIKQIMLITSVSYIATGTAYHVKPLFSNPKVLPVNLYTPFDNNKPFAYFAIYVWEVAILVLIAIPTLLGFNFLFISLIVHLINETKLLRKGFAAVSTDIRTKREEKRLLKELNLLIDHHSLVLCCIKNVRESYSMVLLNQFSTTVFIVSISLLNIIISGFPPDIPQLVKPIPYLVSYMSVLFLNCCGGNLLTTECQSVADVAYQTDWWVKTQPELRRRIALVIQRAQKEEKLTAGGMFDLNLANFTNVVRTAFSFFTLAQAVLANNQELNH